MTKDNLIGAVEALPGLNVSPIYPSEWVNRDDVIALIKQHQMQSVDEIERARECLNPASSGLPSF